MGKRVTERNGKRHYAQFKFGGDCARYTSEFWRTSDFRTCDISPHEKSGI